MASHPSDPSDPHPHVDVGAGRLEAFSDAVMAVIMTILALELRPPEDPTLASLTDRLPGLLIYLLSFMFIAIYWNNHHHLLRATTRISGGVMWGNMFLLFWLSLIPVLTEWLREDPRAALSVACFGVVALCAAIAYTVLVRAIVRANGPSSLVGMAIASDRKGKISLILYAVGVIVASVSVWVSYACYAAVSVIWLVPDRRFVRAHDR